MNGRQLAREAVARRPGIAVLFATGYTRNAIVHHGILDPDVHVVIKPHTFETLALKVSELPYRGQMLSYDLSFADNSFQACRTRVVKPRQSLSTTSQFTQGFRVVVSLVVVTERPLPSVVRTCVEVTDEPDVMWSLI
jgi:hypothetical protein